jgi:transglutaminase-like putative cysteine protease
MYISSMKNAPFGIDLYLQPTFFIDSNHKDVIAYTQNIIGSETDKTKQAIKIYYAVRDDFKYNPYNINLKHEELKASTLINRKSKSGYCTEKACLLAACLRVVGIPSRMCFFDVRNHIGVDKFIDIIKTDILTFHACTDIYLDEKWVKATPAFNKELCEKIGVPALEFDGKSDSIFQQFDGNGHEFMEYLYDFGTFHDIPHDMFVAQLKKHYGHFFTNKESTNAMTKS